MIFCKCLLLISVVIILSCQKNEAPVSKETDCLDKSTFIPFDKGYASGLLLLEDGWQKPILGIVSGTVDSSKKTLNLSITSDNTRKEVRDRIAFVDIPFSKGRYKIKNSNINENSCLLDYKYSFTFDTLVYNVVENDTNEIEVFYIDTLRKIVKVKFNFDIYTDNNRCTLYSLKNSMKIRKGISEFRYQ